MQRAFGKVNKKKQREKNNHAFRKVHQASKQSRIALCSEKDLRFFIFVFVAYAHTKSFV